MLLSQTLKVEENKVPLFFLLEAVQNSYGHFFCFGTLGQESCKYVNINFSEIVIKFRR